MKNIKYIILVIASSWIASSCSDYLESEPLTVVNDGNFYKTKADAEAAIVGCYDGLQKLYNNGVAFPIASEVLSDNAYGGTGNNDGRNFQQIDEFDLSVSPGDVNVFDGNWINHYQAIYRTNVLLQKMDQIDWEGDTAYMESIEAQARFIRAYNYFDMVRLWERVPLLTEPTSGNVPQSDADAIYSVIAEDLKIAAEKGSETVEPGRINKWAAKALLARVYLFYTGYYGATDLVGEVSEAEALQGLEDVIASTSYDLVPSFSDLWPASSSAPNVAGDGLETTYAGKDNIETIFAIKYNITSDWNGNADGNHWLVLLGLRTQTFSPYGFGWGAGTVNPDLYTAYDATDLRRDATILSFADEGIDFDNTDQRAYSGYVNKKYMPLANPDGSRISEVNGGVSFQISEFQDYVVMRYSDVLLMAAELGSPSAQGYLDQVRTRAGLGSVAPNAANILAERRLEFAGEGVRYWDLLRQGVDVAAAAISDNRTLMDGGVPTNKTIDGANLVAKRGFQMIPQNQITRSDGLLTQNTGWE